MLPHPVGCRQRARRYVGAGTGGDCCSHELGVGAYRVHVVPDDDAYVEGRNMTPELLARMAQRGFRLTG